MEQLKEKVTAHKLILRHLTPDDYDDIREIMEKVYSNSGGSWTRKEFNAQLKRFNEGQICIEDKGKVVAAAMSLIVDYSKYGDSHTYDQITGNGLLTTHDPDGDTLYGTDVFVHPEYHNMRLGRRLYDARKELCEKLNLRAIIAGGRIPGYSDHHDELTPMQYIERVKNKELYDPILTFQLNNGFHIKKIIKGYLPDDKESKAYAVLLEWINLYYEEDEKLIGSRKTVARVGVVQWQMRLYKDLEELFEQVEFFVDATSAYKSDFALFPEFFNAPLMAEFNNLDEPRAIREVAQHTEWIRQRCQELARADA